MRHKEVKPHVMVKQSDFNIASQLSVLNHYATLFHNQGLFPFFFSFLTLHMNHQIPWVFTGEKSIQVCTFPTIVADHLNSGHPHWSPDMTRVEDASFVQNVFQNNFLIFSEMQISLAYNILKYSLFIQVSSVYNP